MNQPNVVPLRPAFHRIDSQVVSQKGQNFEVTLNVYVEDVGSETLVFLIPTNMCKQPLTVFTLFRHVDYGWVITKDECPYIVPSSQN